MDRYKLVISDFHIGTGQLMEDGEVNPLEAFIFDGRFISFLEYYMSDDFKRAEVELILNGDFLNTLQVQYGEETPTEVTEAEAVGKARAIFAGHAELFEALKKFAAAPHHRLTYIVGNHDPAILWPAVRQEFNNRLEAEVHYPGFSYSFDGIWVEHGQQYTAANRFDPGRLFIKDQRGDVILNLPWGSVWVIEYLNAIKKEKPWIDRVQPFSRYLLLGLFFNPVFALPALIRLVAFFIRHQLSGGRWKQWGEVKRTWGLLTELSIIPALEKEARKILARPGYHTVILGHNHQPAFRRFGKEKLYVNTGTWNDIIHLDIPNLGRTRRMTYVFIDYPEKRRPRTRLKIWKGTHQTEENVIF
ncbi:MAG TPA: metallophosphoesterase [bacterium]|nr:metallophosphoesterase [bacterium]